MIVNESNHEPLVYIIILTWNRRDEVLGAVRSLSRIGYKNYVPVVVDNASKDDTVEALNANYPRLKVIVNHKNLGYTGGNNVGINYALQQGAEYIILLNNDARVHRNFIDTMLGIMQADDRIAVVGSKNLYENDPNRIWGAWAEVTYGPMLTKIHGRNQLDCDMFRVVKDVDQVIGCGYMWRSKALEDIGLLDTNFFGYHEDTDWCIRAKKNNWRVVYCGNAVVYHKGGVSNNPKFAESMPVMYFLGRNAIIFAKKHAGKAELSRLTINSLMGSYKRIIKARKSKLPSKEKDFLKGLLDGFLGRNSKKEFKVN